MKKVIIVCLLLHLLGSEVIWADKKPFGDGLYWETNNGILTISGAGYMPDMKYSKGPWSSTTFDKVIIEDGVISIGENAFKEYGTDNHIKQVVIPNTVTYIGRSAFEYCSSLESVVIGNSVKTIGLFAFAHCSSLKSIVIPNSVKSIGQCAFEFCENLTSVTYSGSLSNIGRYAFLGCDKLTSFPGSLLLGIMKERQYDSAQGINNGNTMFYIVDKHILNFGYRYGLVNAQGKIIIPTEMEALESAGAGYLRYKLNGFWGLMNYQGKVLIDTDRGYTSIGNYVSFTKRFAYTMTGYKGECDATGRQISKIKVETPQQSVASSSSSSSSTSTSSSSASSNSSSGNSNGGTTTVVVEHHRDPVPVQEWVPCSVCGHNPGVCQTCLGSGSGPGSGGRCISCGYSGKCHFCNGQGGRYQTVYR